MEPVSGWDIFVSQWTFCPQVDVHKDLSNFDKGQIVTARWLGESVSETDLTCHGQTRLIDAWREQSLARVVQSNRRDTVGWKICCVLCCIAADQSGSPCWPLSTAKSTINGNVSIRTGPLSNGSRRPSLMNHVFLTSNGWLDPCASLTWATHGTRTRGSVMFLAMFYRETLVRPSIWMLLWYIPPT